jgi:hypothetical protein
MTFDPYGYTDPLHQAHEGRQQLSRPGISPWPPDGQTSPLGPFPVVPQAPAAGQPSWSAPVGAPLADLPGQVGSVLSGAGYRPRGYHLAEDMAKGAAIGFGAWLVWRRMQRRRQLKGEFTSPGFRALGLLLGFPVLGFILSMVWLPETGWLFGSGTVLGVVGFIVYATYRATGHGRYNSRRQGSPWRDDHRRARHGKG